MWRAINIEASLCAGFTVSEKNILNILFTLPGVGFSQILSAPLVQAIWWFGISFNRRLPLGTKGHCYPEFFTGFVGVNMWQEGVYRCGKRKNYNKHTYKHISGRSFFYQKLPYYSRIDSRSICLKDFMSVHSKKIKSRLASGMSTWEVTFRLRF